MRQAATLDRLCGTCGGPGDSGFAQIGENGVLRWELDEGCASCQVQGCDRGPGPGSAELRDVLGLSVADARETARGPGHEGTLVELSLVAGLLNVPGPVSTRGR
ncbi:hypothetical protein ACFWNN_25975 [Lentzea sp. NPDC058450]|uniref:hypothetical protein n=1 Tax=Lentzea sp. NPDC058450 TaxID=3346505 RepID=UPI00365A27D4